MLPPTVTFEAVAHFIFILKSGHKHDSEVAVFYRHDMDKIAS